MLLSGINPAASTPLQATRIKRHVFWSKSTKQNIHVDVASCANARMLDTCFTPQVSPTYTSVDKCPVPRSRYWQAGVNCCTSLWNNHNSHRRWHAHTTEFRLLRHKLAPLPRSNLDVSSFQIQSRLEVPMLWVTCAYTHRFKINPTSNINQKCGIILQGSKISHWTACAQTFSNITLDVVYCPIACKTPCPHSTSTVWWACCVFPSEPASKQLLSCISDLAPFFNIHCSSVTRNA